MVGAGVVEVMEGVVEIGEEIDVIGVMIFVASKSCKDCFCVLRDAATGLRDGDRMGDSSARDVDGEEGEDGGDMEDELWLSEPDGDEHSPSGFDTLRFTFARLF